MTNFCGFFVVLIRAWAAQGLKLRSALNEKELELIELREQHVQLVVSSFRKYKHFTAQSAV